MYIMPSIIRSMSGVRFLRTLPSARYVRSELRIIGFNYVLAITGDERIEENPVCPSAVMEIPKRLLLTHHELGTELKFKFTGVQFLMLANNESFRDVVEIPEIVHDCLSHILQGVQKNRHFSNGVYFC